MSHGFILWIRPISCVETRRPSGDARSDAGVPEDRNAYEDRQLPLSGNPPAAMDSPVAYGGKHSCRRAGLNFASLQDFSVCRLSYPNSIDCTWAEIESFIDSSL